MNGRYVKPFSYRHHHLRRALAHWAIVFGAFGLAVAMIALANR